MAEFRIEDYRWDLINCPGYIVTVEVSFELAKDWLPTEEDKKLIEIEATLMLIEKYKDNDNVFLKIYDIMCEHYPLLRVQP